MHMGEIMYCLPMVEKSVEEIWSITSKVWMNLKANVA
jgi:hypothetical protein